MALCFVRRISSRALCVCVCVYVCVYKCVKAVFEPRVAGVFVSESESVYVSVSASVSVSVHLCMCIVSRMKLAALMQ